MCERDGAVRPTGKAHRGVKHEPRPRMNTGSQEGEVDKPSTLVFMENPVTHTYGFSTFDLLPGRVLPCYWS